MVAQGVTAPPRSASTLRVLVQNEPVAVTKIASIIRLSHPFVVRILADLERLGLIMIQRDTNDRRRRMVSLTPRGTIEAELMRRTAIPIAAAYASLFDDAKVDLLATLDAIEGALSREPMSRRLKRCLG